jgi:hypothetical protein
MENAHPQVSWAWHFGHFLDDALADEMPRLTKELRSCGLNTTHLDRFCRPFLRFLTD